MNAPNRLAAHCVSHSPFCTLIVFLATAAAAAAAPVNVLTNGDFTQGNAGWEIDTARASESVVNAQAGPFQKALRIAVTPQAGDLPWAIVLRQRVDTAFTKSNPLTLKVWMRSPQSLQVGAYLEEVVAPNTKWLGKVLTLTPDWKEYEFTGPAAQDEAAQQTAVIFHLAYGAGVVELAGARLFDAAAPGDPRAEVPDASHPLGLIRNGDFSSPADPAPWYGNGGDAIKIQMEPASVEQWTTAIRLDLAPPPGAQPWGVSFDQKVEAYVARGEAVYTRAWMRSADRAQLSFVYEQASAPNTKMIEQMVRLTPDWKEYRFVGFAPRSFQPGESQFKFFLGYGKGSVEIAGVRVEDYGKTPRSFFKETVDYWGGQDHPDTWRAAAIERIEKFRKGNLTIQVKDAKGKPVANATVTIDQKQHYFRWGTAGPVARLNGTSPDNLKYQEMVKRLFNTFTFENDLKWQDYPDPKEGRMAEIAKGIEWLKANGVTHIRGHNLLWGSNQYLPAGARDLSPDDLLKACQSRVTEETERWKGKVYLWDVVNEATDNTWLWERIGWQNFADCYKWAHAGDPDALLCYNDYHALARNATDGGLVRENQRIQYLIDHGAPLDMIGEQAHLHTPLLPIDIFLQRLEDLAKFGKPIEITELDLGLQDDETHGSYLRDFLTAAFSHPSVQGVIQWGFWEGSHWRAAEGAALFRKDWTPRPAEKVYEDLVLHQWWTHAALKSNNKGQCATRAFYGIQHITVEKDGKKVEQDVELVPGKEGNLVVSIGP